MSEAKKRRLNVPKQNAEELADDLARGMLFNEATADVWLKVQDERLPAHRAILAARCDYFQAMFYSGMQESMAKEVQRDGKFSPALMKVILRYIYTQQLEPVALDDAVPLMACTDQLGMSKLRNTVKCQISESLSCSTVLEVLTSALASHQELLVEACLEFVPEHALSVLMSDSFLQLEAPTALRVLRATGMQDKSVVCCRAAVKWQAHWLKVMQNDGESQRAREAADHLSLTGGEMRRYIDAATMRVVDQFDDIKPRDNDQMYAEPATIVRRSHRSEAEVKFVTITPSTPQIRFTVHRLKRHGPCLWISPADMVPKRERNDSYHIHLQSNGWVSMGDDRSEPFVAWVPGTMVEVMLTTVVDHQEVSLHNGAGLTHTCTTRSKVKLWLGLRHPGDEVSVEFMS